MLSLPPWTLDTLEKTSPVPFTRSPTTGLTQEPQTLSGIRVLKLCRIIAKPSIGRTLAEYGASVLKVTSPYLPVFPFFQVDGNTGKHTCNIDLKSNSGTGCMGTIAALTGLWRRAKEAGSWVGTTSLCQYDGFLMKLGLYGKDEC